MAAIALLATKFEFYLNNKSHPVGLKLYVFIILNTLRFNMLKIKPQ